MMITNYLVAALSFIMGIGSIMVFTIFLYTGPFQLLPLPFTNNELLVFDAVLSMLFFLQHSVMVRPWFKNLVFKFIPTNYFPAIFSIISGIFLFALMALWQASSVTILSCETTCYWLIRGAFFAMLLLQGWALWTLKEADLFGIKTLIKPPSVSMTTELVFVSGAYRWVRHPIYSTSILLLWLYPNLTMDRLLLNVLFTVWIIIGAIFEERDLVAIHGDAYKKYQSVVPMLIPKFKAFKE